MPRRDVLLAVLVAAIWGVNFTVIDAGLDGVPPLLLSTLRYALASLALLVLTTEPGSNVNWRWVFAVGLVLGGVKFSLLFLGIDQGFPAGVASVALQAQALFTLLFAALLLKERPGRRQLTGLAIAAGGLALITVTRLDGVPVHAALFVLAAAATWGVANLLIRRAAPQDPFAFMLRVNLAPVLPLLLASLLFEGPHADAQALKEIDLETVGCLLYLAFAATVLGWGLWGALLRRHPATTVAPFSLLVPIFGIASAALLRGERVTLLELVATALVLSGIATAQFQGDLSRRIVLRVKRIATATV